MAGHMSEEPIIQFDAAGLKVTLQGPTMRDGTFLTAKDIPFKTFYSVYKILQNATIDPSHLWHLACFAAVAAKGQPLDADEKQRIGAALDLMQLGGTGLFPNEAWQTDEDPVLSITYHLLRSRQITYTQAAAIASELLGQAIKPEAWRKRVDRWRNDRGLPKVGQRKRTP